MATSKEFLKYLTPDQQNVVTTESKNILVSAAAGSGKTFVLTRRVMHLLKDEGYSLDNMVILTFTDLAAKEMKDRIIKALKAFDDPRLKEELSHIDEANISTFDSFCHKFLIENIVYSSFSKEFNIGDPAIFDMMANKFVDEMLDNYIKDNKEEFKNVIKITEADSKKDIKDIILNVYDALLNYKDPLQVADDYINNFYPEEEIHKLIDITDPFLRTKIKTLIRLCDIDCVEGTKVVFDRYIEYFNEILDAQGFKELIQVFLRDIPRQENGKHLVCRKTGATDSEKEDLEDRIDKIKNTFKECKEIADQFADFNMLAESLQNDFNVETLIMSFVRELIVKMNEFKKEYSLYSFQDIEIECINILSKHEEIRNRYKSKIKEFLIDEYQDTNDIQEELISLISNNNVVVVGDIKQSIYRFRNANPSLFNEKLNKYGDDNNEAGKKIELAMNFRSRKEEVLDVSNKIFGKLSKDPEVESDFFKDLMECGNKDYELEEPIENKFKIIEYQKDEKTKKSNEYELLATDILNRVNSKQLVYDKDKFRKNEKGEDVPGAYREIEFSDIMVLCRTQGKFEQLKKVFEDYGIPSVVIADEEYSSSEEIIFLKNALKIVYLLSINEVDTENFVKTLLSLLRSFVIKEDDNKIIEFIADSRGMLEKFEFYFKDLYDNLNDLLNIYNQYGTSFLFNEIVNRFNIYKEIQSLNKKESREIKISILIDQIKVYVKSGMSLKYIIDYFDYLKVNRTETMQRLGTFDDLKCVKIMTMHKSKGLEAPLVYIIGLNGKFAPWQHLGYYSRDLGICFDDTLKHKLFLKKETKETNIELYRLLYVAITRPRESLTLFNQEGFRECKNDIYSFGSLMDMLNYAIEFDDNIYKRFEPIVPENGDKKLPNIKSNAIIYDKLNLKEKELITRKKASHDVEFEVSKEVTDILDKGTLLHSFFEVTNFLADDFDKEIEKKKIATHYIKYLKQFKDSFLFNTPSVREFHELPYFGDNESGVIDYLLEKENEYIIVDFKTSNIDNPAYVNQLNTYKDYLETKTDKPIKMYLYSILKDTFKKIEDN